MPKPLCVVGPGTSDHALMELAQRDDAAAFGVLVARYSTLLEHTVRRVAKSAAEDVAQQAFLSAWLGRHRFEPARGSVRSWLCGIAMHRAIDLHRREQRRGPQAAWDADADALVCPREGPGEAAERREGAATVRRAVQTLGDEQRTVIALGYYAGLSQTEIHQRTQTPLGTVKSRARLALNALRTELAGAA